MSAAAMAEAAFSGPDWPPDILAELAANAGNSHVGSILVSQTDRVRISRSGQASGCRSTATSTTTSGPC
jgi:hypothetical protein